jgi:hypothetical protein
MPDGRKNNGGKRQGAGRKPKANEIAMLEAMDATLAPIEVWRKLADRVNEGSDTAIKTWLSYRYGQPKQSVDHTSEGEKINSVTVRILEP